MSSQEKSLCLRLLAIPMAIRVCLVMIGHTTTILSARILSWTPLTNRLVLLIVLTTAHSGSSMCRSCSKNSVGSPMCLSHVNPCFPFQFRTMRHSRSFVVARSREVLIGFGKENLLSSHVSSMHSRFIRLKS
jgi:hypothetical protein